MKFVAVFHAHQPLGNPDDVVTRITENCYRPFLAALEKAPLVHCGFHASGPLWEWWERHAPDVLAMARIMAARGQMELLVSGWYEPILSAWSSADRQGQIQLTRHHLGEWFGRRDWPGLWLTERVWEPSLPEDLALSGVKYTLVDDRLWYSQGCGPEAGWSPWMTEASGSRVALLPILERLRYLIPFRPLEELRAFLSGVEGTGGALAVYADDVEKFGAWPGTAKWVYEQGWLEEWLSWLSEMGCFSPNEALAECPPAGLCYLPEGAYREMGEWALPPEAAGRLQGIRTEGVDHGVQAFMRGGMWKNFLVRYPEANWMHKKVQELSRMAHRDGRPAVVNEVWAAQGNDAYWHGIFGGLYLPHLRQEVWKHIVKAEHQLAPVDGKGIISVMDWDGDGQEEAWLRTARASATVKLEEGALVDYLLFEVETNYCNVLTRRPEAYHERLQPHAAGVLARGADQGAASIHDRPLEPGETGIDPIIYDRNPRRSAVLYVWPIGTPAGVDLYAEGGLEALAIRTHWAGSVHEASMRVVVARDAYGMSWKKTFGLDVDGSLVVVMDVAAGPDGFQGSCGIEWNLEAWPGMVLSNINGRTRETTLTNLSRLRLPVSRRVTLGGPDKRERRIHVLSGPPSEWWGFPILTVSQSEKGVERLMQGLALMGVWPLRLGPGESWHAAIAMGGEGPVT